MNFRDLRLRVRAVFAPRRVERELDDELAFHIERETRKHVAAGLNLTDARARARARFGSAALAADQCRDARGTAFVDTAVRDVLYALRTFRRTPLVALTIVGTIAVGLGLVAAVFTIFNTLVFSVNPVRDPDALFAVERVAAPNSERVRFTWPDYEALRRETDVFSGAFARLVDIDSRIEGRVMGGELVTGNYFDVLGVNAALGRSLTPADDVRHAGRQVLVLSHRGWSRLFASDPDIVGREMTVSGFRYVIVGVMPERFRGLGLAPPDYWAPLSLMGQVRPIHAGREDTIGIEIIGRLKPGLSRTTALAGLAVWASRGAGGLSADGRPGSITLEPRRTFVTLSAEVVLVFLPIFFVFGLILLIGCANVANLLLARALSRQREIGIRLSVGASRHRIIRQLLTESLVLALASAVCAFAIARLVLQVTVSVVLRTLPPELAENVSITAPGTDWRVAVFLVIAAIASTVLFGLVPALQGTRLDLIRTMRGEVTSDSRPRRARNALIVVQVTASALLLICASIFLRGALRASTADPGWRLADNVIVEINNEPFRQAMVAATTADPAVTMVAAMWPGVLGQPRAVFASASAKATADKQAAGRADGARSPEVYRFVSPEYFSLLDIRVLRGRAFTQSEASSNAAVAMVSESTARTIWPNQEAVGQVLRLEADQHSETRRQDEPTLPSSTFTVVGVVRDVAGFRMAGYPEAGVYVPASPARAETDLIARVHGDPEIVRRTLVERLTSIDPNMGLVLTMRTLGRMETYLLQVGFWVTVVLGGLALILTVSGVFGVLSYLVERRTKEIGVRIALGATSANVTALVLGQSLRVVGIGLIAGAALAWILATVLMTTSAAAQIGGIVNVFDLPAYAASLLCIVIACILAASLPAARAARIDPIATLRQD
ncbi:MAG: ABC transporter permease [Acidobacteria bacterium]|nr:ABC transporter permease [Acidobacteriota bacterium]